MIVFLKVTQQHLINLLQRIRQHEDRNDDGASEQLNPKAFLFSQMRFHAQRIEFDKHHIKPRSLLHQERSINDAELQMHRVGLLKMKMQSLPRLR